MASEIVRSKLDAEFVAQAVQKEKWLRNKVLSPGEHWEGWERQASAWQKNAELGLGAPRSNFLSIKMPT